MMTEKWYLIENTRGDVYETELKATTKADALAEAKLRWNKLSDHDKKHTSDFFAVLTTLNENETADLDAESDRIGFDVIKSNSVPMCTILVNGSDTKRQTIYWDKDDLKLHSDYDGEPIDLAPELYDYDEACKACKALWSGSGWELEWIDEL